MPTKSKRPSARCSVSSEPDQPSPRPFRGIVLGGTLLILALGGAFLVRLFSPLQQPSMRRQTRPIVQIVRQQPGLPDIADVVDRICPSVATVVPQGSDVPPQANGAPAAVASEY